MVHTVVTKYEKCLPAGKFVRRIGDLSPTTTICVGFSCYFFQVDDVDAVKMSVVMGADVDKIPTHGPTQADIAKDRKV